MINYLKGKILFSNSEYISVVVNNVGYKVEIVAGRIYNKSDEIEIYIFTHVREDSFRLFGFDSQNELNLFEKLLSVSGVGPKSALALLEIGVDSIVSGVKSGNLKAFKVKGIGSKTLEKITLELGGKLDEIKYSDTTKKTIKQVESEDKKTDIIDALSSLGFKKAEIEEAYSKISLKDLESKDHSVIMKMVLQNLRSK